MSYPFRSRRAHWAALAIGAALVAGVAYHVICGEHGYLAYRRARQQYLLLQEQSARVRKENQTLQELIDKLNARDPATIEKQAREQLHMARPNELVFTLPRTPSKAKDGSASKDSKAGAP